jgi:predicted phage terminase large subunit-like protein|tara:strand:- start:5426 stop:6886 length:1461 start_codon:yes stop_codon:yes gene_type:complete
MSFNHLSDAEIKEALALRERLNLLKKQEICKTNFLEFIDHMWDGFICGRHHKIFAEKLEGIANGTIKRLIVNMPPRHTKSEFASTYFPAWIMGRDPSRKIMQTTHTGELAVRFGRKVRNMMDSDIYKQIFPEVSLSSDSKSAGRWETNKSGEYFAAGVGGAITGRGADLLIIDDPHSEQDAMSPTAMESCWEWYTSGPRQRLQPGGSIVLVMTRWSGIDLTAKLLEAQKEALADQWEIVEFPAIFPETENPLWEEFWSLEELLKVKASLPVMKWNAQWMQTPTSEEGSIVKREWWQKWESDTLPNVSYIIQSYDTAFSKKENADYSAISTWGVFRPDEDSPDSIILLDCQKGRYDFPELKRLAMEEYKYWEPDMVLIEAKASGTPLTHELRRLGIPVVNYSPTRGHDKTTRMHSVAPIFESGLVYAPQKAFAEEMIEECASFPFGANDDLCDTMTQALIRFREGGLLSLHDDYEDSDQAPIVRSYY